MIPTGSTELTRSPFGGTIADTVMSRSANGVARFAPATVTFWDAPEGGNQYDDLLLENSPTSSVVVSSTGQIPIFYGPPGVSQMWADDQTPGNRVIIVSVINAAEYAQEAQEAAAYVYSIGTGNDAAVATVVGTPGSATRAAVDARWAVTANRPITLRDNAALDFTGSTDSRVALQTALTDAGSRRVELGREGTLRIGGSGVTLPQFQTLKGSGQFLGAGGTAPSELIFPDVTGTMAGITGGGNNVIEDIVLRGPGATVAGPIGFKSDAGAPRFTRVGFFGWEIGTKLTNSYYSKFDLCQWSRNKYGLVNTGCYNLHLDTPMFYCAYGPSDSLFGGGVNGAARGMKITGGSIESYGPLGAVAMADLQVLNLDGTYFESSVAGSNPFGINATGRDKVTINARGCTVYLNEHTRWMYFGSSTNVTVHSQGNKFICPTTSAVVPVAYYFNDTDAGNIKGRIGRDDWSEVAKVGSQYVQASVFSLGQIPDLDIRHPSLKFLGGDVCGNGSPEGVVPGPIGSVYRRLDGGATTTLYVKTSGTGNTGWTAK